MWRLPVEATLSLQQERLQLERLRTQLSDGLKRYGAAQQVRHRQRQQAGWGGPWSPEHPLWRACPQGGLGGPDPGAEGWSRPSARGWEERASFVLTEGHGDPELRCVGGGAPRGVSRAWPGAQLSTRLSRDPGHLHPVPEPKLCGALGPCPVLGMQPPVFSPPHRPVPPVSSVLQQKIAEKSRVLLPTVQRGAKQQVRAEGPPGWGR